MNFLQKLTSPIITKALLKYREEYPDRLVERMSCSVHFEDWLEDGSWYYSVVVNGWEKPFNIEDPNEELVEFSIEF